MSDATPAHRPGTAAQGAAYLSAGYGLLVGLGFAVHALASRRLDAADYGRLVVALSAGTWLKTFVNALFVPGLAKIVSEDHRRLRVALSQGGRWHLAACLAAAAAFAGASPLLGRLLGDRALAPLLALAGLETLLYSRTSLRANLLQALRRYSDAAAAFACYSVFRAAGAGTLILLGLGAVGAMAGLSCGPAAAWLLAAALIWRVRARLPSQPYPALWTRSLSWTAMMLPAEMATATLMCVDVWIVKAVVADPAAVGPYGAAYAVARLADVSVQGLSQAVFSRVSGAAASANHALARSVSTEAMRFVLIVLTPICLLAAGSSRQIMALLFGAPYAVAGPLLTLLLASASCMGGTKLLAVLLAAVDRPAHKSALVLGLLPVGVAACLGLTLWMGPIGAAAGSLITAATGLLAGAALVRRHVGAYPPPLSVLRCGLAGGVVLAAGLLWPVNGILLLAKLAALGVLYLALLFAGGELGAGELRAMRRAAL
jgi:O-antigen/teichoic acid export membrane protein